MAGFDYGRMQGTATRLLGRFSQGSVQIVRETLAAPDPQTPWVPGAAVPQMVALKATVRRVEQKYVDGTTVLATDDQITFAPPGFEPDMQCRFVVDGQERALKMIRRVPAAGPPVVFIAFVGS